MTDLSQILKDWAEDDHPNVREVLRRAGVSRDDVFFASNSVSAAKNFEVALGWTGVVWLAKKCAPQEVSLRQFAADGFRARAGRETWEADHPLEAIRQAIREVK